MNEFWISFLALFVAVDAIGTLPIFINLTKGLAKKKVVTIVGFSVVTALIVGHLFLLVGNKLLKFLGITMADFMIAGGIILFLLTINELVGYEKKEEKVDNNDIGPVPLGVPLIVGPGVITTAMLLVEGHGLLTTSMALASNVVLAGVIFISSSYFSVFLGKNGEKIISKLAALLLAAYAVMMVRKGIMELIH